ncbi:hypothetical protein SAMN05216559_1561 [Halomicrobium zhouii]|uniref:Uncharacterized protein n=1 Tax=Halomicrobium zhouii TaxID=767519 RepID=A0A1I6KZB3_9EURY|nr:hypothetical protein [Halomicrobium zhouii]SFR96338.1 hypothetical protein SAMN05216559_1561 [Halomicrobium zhouii]
MTTSSSPDEQDLVDDLLTAADGALRSVAVYYETDYEMLYMRENVDVVYSHQERDAIFDDLRLEGWGRDRLQDLFNAGELECSVYGFDEAMMLHFVKNGFEGVFVTYDRGEGIDVEEFIRVCERHF